MIAMIKKGILFIGVIGLFFLSQDGIGQIVLTEYASGLSSPVDIQNAGDGRLFIVEQPGRIRIIDENADVLATPFLNITSSVATGGERGLLGLAFHPDYENNGYFYVNYTNNSGGLNTRISRFSVSATNPNLADASSELILLSMPQPFSNHNGGCVQFGPDGFLYIGMGDGGSAGDPGNRSQNINEIMGKMLRIDVDNTQGALNYAIPADNPFVGVAGLDEIYSTGLRNPWRFSFDKDNGDLWIADVGQNAWEEVNYSPNGTALGVNFGWRCYEGNAIYNNSGCGTISNYEFPVYVYNHSFGSGGYSISGGYVYRGQRYASDFDGLYFTADYVTGNWWTIDNTGSATFFSNLMDDVSSFGEDVFGELYVANLGDNKIYSISSSNALPNQNCASAVDLPCESGSAGNSAGTTQTVQRCNDAANISARGSWFKHTATTDVVNITACNVNYDSRILVYEGSCASPVCVTGNDNNYFGECPFPNASSASFAATQGTTYYIFVTGQSNADTGDFYIELNCTCPDYVQLIGGNDIFGSLDVGAEISIAASNTVDLNGTEMTSYKAGQYIDLLPEFEVMVQDNSIFEVIPEICF